MSRTERQSWRNKLINPVLNKEFTLRMRTPRSMWALLAYLIAIGTLALGFMYVTQMESSGGGSFDPNASRIMFYFISMVQLGLIAFMAPGLTAGVVSGEREKQTLNLLLTTQQSSATIIISKLVSSLSFMLLITVATLPVYSIVFLFGGISPAQLGMVFLFYLFTMLAIGSLGIMFSTLFKRTMIAVIVTYGVMLFLFGGTAFLYLVLHQIMESINRSSASPVDFSWIGYILGLNPAAALYSVFDPSISSTVFRAGWTGSGQQSAPIQLWQEFLLVFTVITGASIAVSIRYIRPRLKKAKD
ncbi:ABC transporter permease [Paenibacillus sambharensis]|uniref:ABC transporter permease n=1 Tax=Paenibacillus sambharensis TaxID=1803190 RepID=A0A2W1LBZ2_9BACL|nr:ABC transporter permease [Paenibacillus sambharensis]PZD96239.1 ABC transporter permease [Paenibacillus sambharensis]